MYSFSSDTKFLIITDGVEVWKLEKNQVSLKTANELVIIDRNGMHYKNFAYTEVVGNFANATAVVAYLETLVNTGQTISIDISTLATEATLLDINENLTDGIIVEPVHDDILGVAVSGTRNNQIEVSFDTAFDSSVVTNTSTSTGSATISNGHALYSTGTNANGTSKAVSVITLNYRPAHEEYVYFTAAFTTPTSANSNQRLGLYDANNGFFIGYNGLNFGITKRTSGSDTFTNRTSWNTDLLTGLASSKFTRNGTPEAINLTYSNLFRIRFAWLGSASVVFEVFSPDGKWVIFHTLKVPNSQLNPSITTPNLPITLEVLKSGADATNLIVYTACWAAGTTSNYSKITDNLTDNTLANLTRSVITGRASTGGGSYYNVKVEPSGKLLVTDDAITDGTQIAQIVATEEDGSYPDPNVLPTGNDVKPNIDKYGNLRVRSEVLTDELSIRDDFSGNTLSVDWTEEIVGGASVSVANSNVTLSSSTANGNIAKITYSLDYLPLTLRTTLDISQRIANQTIFIGFVYRDAGVITQSAYIEFVGTDNQKINCVSQSSADASDIQTTSNITIPSALNTSQKLYYKIDVSNNAVTFQVSSNGLSYVPLAQHTLHIPTPYQPLDIEANIENTATVTNTDVNIDLVFANNMNRVQVDQDFTGEPLPSQLIGSVGNTYKNVNATPTGDLKVELSGNNTSAFGDINVAELTPVLQVDFVYGILTSLGGGTIANGGIVDGNSGRLRLQTGTNTAGSAIYQTIKVAKYRPGQGVDAKFTRVFETGVANSQQEIGMGDLVDGYFYGYVGTQFGIISRNRSVQTFIPQKNWNVDACDGTGLSDFNINPTLGNVFRIKYPYLGYGDVKFFIQDSNSGQFILVHVIKYANSSTSTQLSNPNLSFWARNVNTGNNTNLTGYVGSAGVFLSGIRKYIGQTGYAFNNKALTTGGGITNLFTIKNASSFNGITNKSLIRLTSNVFSAGNLGVNQFGYLFLIKNATLGGTPSFIPDNGTTVNNGATITNGQSPVSVDKSGTTVTGGINEWASNAVNTSNSFIDVTEFDIFLAPGETLTFAGFVTSNASLSAVSNYILDI